MGYKLNVTISLPPFSYYLLPLLVCAKLAFGKVGVGMTGTKESVERDQQQLGNYPISKKISVVISEKKKTSNPCNKYCIFKVVALGNFKYFGIYFKMGYYLRISANKFEYLSVTRIGT